MPSTILITGANRGIGLGLTKVFLMRPSTTVVAAVRDPSSAKSLSSLPTAADSRLIVVKVDSTSSTDALSAVDSLKSQGISHLDVVIANSGIASHYGPAASTPLEEARAHFEVNALGPLALFQATMPLLQKSDVTPKFVAVSTILSSLGDMEQMPMPTTAYGSSKAALNYIVRKIHFENEWLIVFPIHPGWVQTDMGNAGARSMGMEAAPVTTEDSVNGLLDKIDNATREKTSGTLQSFDGHAINW